MEDALDWQVALLLFVLFSPDQAKEHDAGQANNACQHRSPNSGCADASLKQKDKRGGCTDHLGLAKSEAKQGSLSDSRVFGSAGRVSLSGHSAHRA
jgi:hypothetical protein